MKKFEYHVEDEFDVVNDTARLNALGDQGWELVQLMGGVSVFKRVKAEDQHEKVMLTEESNEGAHVSH